MGNLLFIYFIFLVWFFVSKICFIGIGKLYENNNESEKDNIFCTFKRIIKAIGYYCLAGFVSISLTAGILIANDVSFVFDDGYVMNNSNNLQIYTESVVE